MKDSRVDRELYYRCPMKWEQLEATRKEDVRHCGACDEKVHFCHTPTDYDRHAAQGHCVAFHPARCGDEIMSTLAGSLPGVIPPVLGMPSPGHIWKTGLWAAAESAVASLDSKIHPEGHHLYCHKNPDAEE